MNESLRARKKEATRAALVDAASRLFAERGFEGATVDDIAGLAGVSRRTFFRYFPSKEDVAFPDHEERLELFTGLLERPDDPEGGAGPSAWSRVRAAFVALGEELTSERERAVRLQQVIESSDTLVAADRARDLQWEQVVAEALVAEWPSDEARILAGAVMGAVRATLRAWFAADGRTDLVRAGLATFELLERGLGSDRGAFQAPVDPA